MTEFQMDYSKGVINTGNNARLHKLFKKAEAGADITIGFIGGSITQGARATNNELCYAYRTFQWWNNTFPKSRFTYVNAGIGGTTSEYGASRVEDDLLKYNPDFVVVEFSVNDEDTEYYKETYEGLVRHIYYSNPDIAVILFHNIFYNDGKSALSMHSQIGKYYNIPSAGMKNSLYALVEEGKIDKSLFTEDDLHPNDYGHELVAGQITYLLDLIRALPEDIEINERLNPLTSNRFEKAIRYNRYSEFLLKGFSADDTVPSGTWDCFKNGFIAAKQGDELTLEIEASVVTIAYRKTINKPAPIATVYIDGNKAGTLDANFDETWGDLLCLNRVYDSDSIERHIIKIVIDEVHKEDMLPFYLVGVISA